MSGTDSEKRETARPRFPQTTRTKGTPSINIKSNAPASKTRSLKNLQITTTPHLKKKKNPEKINLVKEKLDVNKKNGCTTLDLYPTHHYTTEVFFLSLISKDPIPFRQTPYYTPLNLLKCSIPSKSQRSPSVEAKETKIMHII